MSVARNARISAIGPRIGLNLNAVELEVLRDLASGKKPIEIAKDRECSGVAVSYWLRNARLASGAKTNFQLIAMAVKEGVVQ